jgi:hydroxyacyl-ACP dehydratase HTD2-like protein with hotdog domain
VHRWSPTSLFRFSALTFNAHKIHYNEDWTNNVEGHPGLVVHGPLNLINILNFWQDFHGKGAFPTSINYRALSPLYAGQKYLIQGTRTPGVEAEYKWEVVAQRDDVLCMRAEIVG